MFYSHEILTSRKYGVATVWLVATLGSKSHLKKINRKAIFEVNIPKACQTVSDPEAPMALRLQSNLLYGISRVYFQQCTYILVDAQSAQSNMKALMRVVKTSELDPDAGKARPEQLVLQDDPSFNTDNIYPMMDLDFSILESSQPSARSSSLLSKPSQPSSRSSPPVELLPGIEIPASGSSGADFGGFELAGEVPGSAGQERRITLETEEEGFLPDVDFDFDEEGNIIDLGATAATTEEPALPRFRSDSQVSERVRMEHQEGFTAERQPVQGEMELNQPFFEDNRLELPPAEPFPERLQPEAGSQQASQETSSEYVDAPPPRKPRRVRTLPVDQTLEIRHSELQRWNDEYVVNMAEVRHQKALKSARLQSKKNAAHFVFGSGLGGIGSGIGTISSIPHPLAHLFSGLSLLHQFHGPPPLQPTEPEKTLKRRSRSPSSEGTIDSETRRKRQHAEEDQVGRGGADDVLPIATPFDADASIELARRALPLMEDPHSSQMPWNISSRAASHASRPGSVAAATRPPSLTMHGALGSLPGSATSFDRRASRLPSVSPLVRSSRATDILNVGGTQSSSAAGGAGDTGMLLGFPSGGPEAEEDESALRDFRLLGPTAEAGEPLVGPQGESQGTAASMDRESGNFLEFVRQKIGEKKRSLEAGGSAAEGEEEELEGEAAVGAGFGGEELGIDFEELLPPAEHQKAVAAQAFLHVLSLANRGLLSARQEVGREEGEWWKPVTLRLVEGLA